MKYDLIVVGGGPGGLMAAKTAAEDGLKVVLIERKRNITEINRACCQIFYTNKLSPSGNSETGTPHSDGYIEPVSVECEADKTRFHFPVPGFSVNYTGPLRPYLNWIHISPSGHQIHRYKLNDKPWGFYYHKETFVADLLASGEKAGAEVWTETIGLGAENTSNGVRVRIRGKSGEQTLEARTAIAADGLHSKIVESLGLNETRQVRPRGQGGGFVHYIMEGVETGLPDSSWLTWIIPSLNPYGSIPIGMSAENRHTLAAMGADETVLNKFINHPKYAHMFRHAQVVKKETMGLSGIMFGPIREAVVGNVVIVGDAGAIAETWVQGAVACGYQAVKAIEKELNGQKGYSDYMDWWQHAFAFNTPDYLKMLSFHYPLNRVCTDEEVDYIFSLFHDKLGIPHLMVANNLEPIKQDRPELYDKLVKCKEESMWQKKGGIIMKYDLIVVGGGPGGLMAAKIAAEDGLKVLLVEKKRDITEGKLWGEMWYIRKISALAGGKTYMEPTAIEIGSETNRLIWPTLGFSFDYDGPLRPFQNWAHVSPAGYQIQKYKVNSEIWAFSIPNSELLRVLLSLVEKAGAEVWTETIGLGAENTSGGVKVRVKTKSGEQTLEARAAIAADGLDSKIVDSLGLNQGRPTAGPPRLTSGNYVVEGLEPNLPECCMAMVIIPSLNPYWNIGIGYPTLGKTSVSTLTTGTPSPFTVLDSFMQHPTFAPWFRHARVVKKAGGYSGILRLPIREPVVGNVVLVGDTAAPVETWRHGAIASGYQAVKAIEKELNGQKGYPEYIDWWQHAFAFNQTDPDYFKVINDYYNLNKLCTDEEVDYIFSLFLRQLATPSVMPAQDLELIKAKRPELDYIQSLLVGKLGIPKIVVAKSLELIEKERPGLYEKLVQSQNKT